MRVLLAAAAALLVSWSGAAAAKNVGTVVLVGKPGANNKFVVATDAGTSVGVKKGDTLCVFDEDDAEVTCGVVVVAKPTAASLFFDVAFLKRVKKGQRVELKAAPTPAKPAPKPAKPGKTPPKPVEDNDDQDEGDELDGASTPGAKGGPRKKIVFSYLYGALQPIAYNGVGFNPDSRTAAGTPSWTKRETVTAATVGFGLAYHAPLSNTLELATTLLVLQPDDVKGKTVMTSAGVTDEVTATTEARYRALAFDAHYAFMRGSSWQATTTSGLSFLQSIVAVNAKIVPGTADAITIADYSSYLYALGLDLGAAFDYTIGAGFLVHLGVTATVPVTKLISGSSGSTDFTKVDLGEADHTLKALDKAVDHKPNGVGARVGLGLGWSF